MNGQLTESRNTVVPSVVNRITDQRSELSLKSSVAVIKTVGNALQHVRSFTETRLMTDKRLMSIMETLQAWPDTQPWIRPNDGVDEVCWMITDISFFEIMSKMDCVYEFRLVIRNLPQFSFRNRWMGTRKQFFSTRQKILWKSIFDWVIFYMTAIWTKRYSRPGGNFPLFSHPIKIDLISYWNRLLEMINLNFV